MGIVLSHKIFGNLLYASVENCTKSNLQSPGLESMPPDFWFTISGENVNWVPTLLFKFFNLPETSYTFSEFCSIGGGSITSCSHCKSRGDRSILNFKNDLD